MFLFYCLIIISCNVEQQIHIVVYLLSSFTVCSRAVKEGCGKIATSKPGLVIHTYTGLEGKILYRRILSVSIRQKTFLNGTVVIISRKETGFGKVALRGLI